MHDSKMQESLLIKIGDDHVLVIVSQLFWVGDQPQPQPHPYLLNCKFNSLIFNKPVDNIEQISLPFA